uniref:Cytohesin 2 n=1 Tax=Sinocyclocheilus grahami TaxID=75366 RepID=A0A672LAE9_SINGR
MTFDSDTYMPKSKAPKMDDLDYIPADLSPEERSELEEIRRRKGALFLEIQRLKEELREAIIEVEGLESSTEGSKTLQKSRHVAMGRKKFNMDPKKGIVFLVENELLRHTSEDIAQFLYKGEGLNKTAIGDYLGERDDFNIKVLQAFVDLHEFTDLNLVQALRQFLWSFRLPGEAQKIDRMMEAFAQRYCHCNPGVFQSTDTCYVLSFSIIMLNTSLHNPNVRDKPTVERFISMNRGINDGGDLPEELLRVSVNNISQFLLYFWANECLGELKNWVKRLNGNDLVFCFRSAVSVDPFYEMLAARKKRISLKKKEEQP